MQVKDIISALGLTVLSGNNGLSREVTGGYASDLLSDVMGNCESGQVWITVQTHKNVMAIASLRELAAIILVKGNKPEPETAEKSEEEGIPILGTDLPTFTVAGQLYQLLHS
ncbi:MAG TPA: DRTGG domain-containing protein [Bacteroidales bacterium]|nr:DRTGG domain-containing protein [Bacteroidales bacterium]HPS73432.1 DRTGG domain-containing protein [Bacteroidales bacterium]